MELAVKYNKVSDLELAASIIDNDSQAIEYYLYHYCENLFSYLIEHIFHDFVEKDEIITEFYLYLRKNDWQTLRVFEGKSKLITWTSVVATRFFKRKLGEMIDLKKKETLYDRNEKFLKEICDDGNKDFDKIELYDAINKMPNSKYRFIILSELYGDDIEDVAKKLNTNLDNLYNLKRRAKLQLKAIIND